MSTIVKIITFLLLFAVETYAAWSAVFAKTYAEGAYWFALAIYASVAIISYRQVANGHSFFGKKR